LHFVPIHAKTKAGGENGILGGEGLTARDATEKREYGWSGSHVLLE
jgi:hypothetical protein